MCGRYTLIIDGERIAQATGWTIRTQVYPRYNIAPTQTVLAARRQGGGEPEVAELRWGLIPYWAKDPAVGNRMINARSETLLDRPAFREPLASRRCLVLANGFYEWQATSAKSKQPWYFAPSDGALLTFAGLWERWVSPQGQLVETCTIITTAGNGALRGIHERMPVVIAASDRDAWLDVGAVSAIEAYALLRPAPDELLQRAPVSTAVNKADNDGPSLVQPLALSGDLPHTKGSP